MLIITALLGLITPTVASQGSDAIIDLACMKNEKTSAGSEDTTYQIYVTNGGTTRDTITLSTIISGLHNGAQASKWDIRIAPDSLTIDPARTEITTLHVKASCGCEIGHEIEITVTGTSQADPSKSDSVITYTTRGEDASSARSDYLAPDPAPSFTFSLEDGGTGGVNPGIPSHYNLLLDNTWDGIQSFYFTIPFSFSENWTIQFTPSVVALDGSAIRNVDLAISVNGGIDAGEYDLTVMAVSNEAPSLVQSVPLKLDQQPQLGVKDIWSADPEKVGDKPQLWVQVENTGSATATDVEVTVTIGDEELDTVVIDRIIGGSDGKVSVPWEPEKKKNSASIRIDFKENDGEPIEDSQQVESEITVSGTDVEGTEAQWKSLTILMVILIIIAIIILVALVTRARNG